MKVDVGTLALWMSTAISLLVRIVGANDDEAARQRLADQLDVCNSNSYYGYDYGPPCSSGEFLDTDCTCGQCPKCPSGERMSERCGYGIGHSAISCVPCGHNEFSDHGSPSEDWRHTCEDCDNCPALGRYEIAPCLPHSNAQCSTNCKSGCTAPNDDFTDIPWRPTQCVCETKDIQTTAIPVNASIPEPKKGAAEAINTPESDKGSATQAMKTGGVRDGSTDRDIYTYVAIGVGLALFLATTILVATTCWKYRAEILLMWSQQYRPKEDIEMGVYPPPSSDTGDTAAASAAAAAAASAAAAADFSAAAAASSAAAAAASAVASSAAVATVSSGGGEVKVAVLEFGGPPANDESVKAVPVPGDELEVDREEPDEDPAPPTPPNEPEEHAPSTPPAESAGDDTQDEGEDPVPSTPLVGGSVPADDASVSDSELGAVGGRAAPVRRARLRGQQRDLPNDSRGSGRWSSRDHYERVRCDSASEDAESLSDSELGAVGGSSAAVHGATPGRSSGHRRQHRRGQRERPAANHRGGVRQPYVDRGRRGHQATNTPPNVQNPAYMPLPNGPVEQAMPSSRLQRSPSRVGDMAIPQNDER